MLYIFLHKSDKKINIQQHYYKFILKVYLSITFKKIIENLII